MDLDLYVADNKNQVMEALEEYVRRCFQGSEYWFDQGGYSVEKNSPLELKFNYGYIEPLIEYLNIPHEFVGHNTGHLGLSEVPYKNNIYIDNKHESIYFVIEEFKSDLTLYFGPIVISVGNQLKYPDNMLGETDLPLADKNNKVYFFNLSKELRSKLMTASQKTQSSCSHVLLYRYNNKMKNPKNLMNFGDKIEQIYESFLELSDDQIVFCNFDLTPSSPGFKWWVLNPQLALYPKHFSDKIESDPLKFDIDDILIFGWTFQMYLQL